MASPAVKLAAASATRVAVLASADISFRRRVKDVLSGLRWQVTEAGGGAEALARLDAAPTEALILDSWLPDLEIQDFVAEFSRLHPDVDLVTVDQCADDRVGARSPRRNELLLAIRKGQDGDGAAWDFAPEDPGRKQPASVAPVGRWTSGESPAGAYRGFVPRPFSPAMPQLSSRIVSTAAERATIHSSPSIHPGSIRLPELVGEAPVMIEVSRRIRLVAPLKTSVLIQGPTGTGKEVVARALHRLSPRAEKPFVALNCAAIPDALLEAELFGHTRGAFTGAVQGRVGRIEAAHGGTLFLDEIGEMPLALQAKLLRFVECGELQRVGENEPVRVDVRIVAATHQPLGELTREGKFRADLYYRLSVFLIKTPALAVHAEDLPLLVNHFLARLAASAPAKTLSDAAIEKLGRYCWPGNVRQLEHVLERAAILAGESPMITEDEVEFGDDGL
jgi:DNA-binding NtrC family response regulator